ncbi:hypothetical protein L1887_01720 [Cichorium endivia]|nr:hypothetical protein L1887_01720 [Cichorium endivia]
MYDWSMGRVGIITSRRTWINEEIEVEAGGQIFRIGVVEYTDDWSPFRPVLLIKQYPTKMRMMWTMNPIGAQLHGATWKRKNQKKGVGGTNGLIKKLAPLGCFGPFPSNLEKNGPSGSSGRKRRSKRRHADSDGHKCSPRSSPRQMNEPCIIDINAKPQASAEGASVGQQDDESNYCSLSQTVDEVSETIAIGNELGFQSEQGNALIVQSIGENGEHNNNQ